MAEKIMLVSEDLHDDGEEWVTAEQFQKFYLLYELGYDMETDKATEATGLTRNGHAMLLREHHYEG
jgi:hypothetical protein